MNFTYENQSTNTYLVYKIGAEEIIDTMSLGMITNNSIPGLAPAQFTQMDETKFIKYNISGRISVSQLFTGPVNRKRLLGIFHGIVNAMLSAEDYMLDSRSILLNLDYIFVNITTCESVLICLPLVNTGNVVDLRDFFRNIMFRTQFDQTEDCDHVAQIINYLNSVPIFSLVDFRSLIKAAGERPEINKNQKIQSAMQPVQPTREPERPVIPVVADIPVILHKPEQPVVSRQIPSVEPVQVPPVVPVTPAEDADVSNEKPMSMFYLLQHFSKENMELYKAQKAVKKNKKTGKTSEIRSTSVSFDVPGTGNELHQIPGVSQPMASQPIVSQPKPVPVQPKKQPQKINHQFDAVPAQPVYPVKPMSPSLDFGDTDFYDDGSGQDLEATTLLDMERPEQQMIPHLLSKKNNEKIPVNKPIFRLGRDESFNDYVIAENRYIGHSHCHIITRNGEYFIVDDNSKNHTYLDGVMITSGMEVKLTHGQIVRLANDEFEFRLY